MKRYWDSSALVDALHDARVEKLARERDHWMHARAAAKAGVAELLTDNLSDFNGLEDGFTVSPP